MIPETSMRSAPFRQAQVTPIVAADLAQYVL